MATPVYSHQIILPESRQIVLVKARPGERVHSPLVINPSPTQIRMLQSCDDILSVFNDGGPDYKILLMGLKTDQGSVPALVPLDGSHVLDHETCVKLARYITPCVSANDFSKEKINNHLVEINGNNVEEGEEEGEVCSICLDGIKTGDSLELTECEHRYHEECIENWLQLKQNCPICRAEI
ncbi:putative transcription factor C2H2 family [Helianthus annuus]|nr:putative transcription factor C2H2 family [Helianthus annuus]KAJ0553450.1 putative transcription factor C2H2 family [Helianthus annuus]